MLLPKVKTFLNNSHILTEMLIITICGHLKLQPFCFWSINLSVWLSQTETMLKTAENLVGPYVWGQYDILLLPPSFPYAGMENPCLTYATPTLLVRTPPTPWMSHLFYLCAPQPQQTVQVILSDQYLKTWQLPCATGLSTKVKWHSML